MKYETTFTSLVCKYVGMLLDKKNVDEDALNSLWRRWAKIWHFRKHYICYFIFLRGVISKTDPEYRMQAAKA
jgi:hypothetical protein